MATNTGFIGLGAMGLSMARNLHAAGLLNGVWNRSSAKAKALAAELGCTAFETPAELAASCAVIFICVSRDDDVLGVIDQLAGNLHSASIVVDCSTVAVETAQQASFRVGQSDGAFLDAPVSGGTEGAKNGTLAIMVGGEAAVIQQLEPQFQAIGSRVEHMGDVGSGQGTKAVNQIVAAGVYQGVTEALAFAAAMQLPLAKVIDVVGSGAAGNWFLQHRGPAMCEGVYEPGFKVELHDKDLRICQRMAAKHGVELQSIERCLQDYAQLMAMGHGNEDTSALFRLKKELFTG